LFVGNLGPPAMIHALQFDDETYEFKLVNNITADSSHPWITFNVCCCTSLASNLP
ncbi:hypothetical protein GQ53DRAFT_608105, partial [Thozetella sp. PMI_491]